MPSLRSRIDRLALRRASGTPRPVLFAGTEADASALRAGGGEAHLVCDRLGLDLSDVDCARASAALIPGRLYVPQHRRPGASVIVIGGVAIDF